MAEPHAVPSFEHVHFKTADDLMGALMPVCGLDTRTVAPTFIFRGHGDVEWELKPTALRLDRTKTTTEALARVDTSVRLHADEQVFAEFLLLHAFMEACDRAVIALPGDGPTFRKLYMDRQDGYMAEALKDPARWPCEEQLPLLAFAQHHGIPTRLLDWTHSAVVAAYFAAESSWRQGHQRDMAIWALNVEYVHLYKRLQLVQMPGANSARLGAQRGLFTCVRMSDARGETIGDSSLSTALTSRNENPTKPKPLWRLTVPSSENVRLLYLCHLNGVDGSTVYPGPAGAAAATLERAAWLRNDAATGKSVAASRPVRSATIASERTP